MVVSISGHGDYREAVDNLSSLALSLSVVFLIFLNSDVVSCKLFDQSYRDACILASTSSLWLTKLTEGLMVTRLKKYEKYFE